jgi:hypothetical protein
MPPESWAFEAANPRVATVTGARPAPSLAYFEQAVPQLAAAGLGRVAGPCVVVGRISGSSATTLPNRAKALLDALHQDRRGPRYADLGAEPPIPDDNPAHVRGLALELRVAREERVEYRLGTRLLVGGELQAAVNVPAAAPNDIWADARERALIAERRSTFAAALAAAWADSAAPASLEPDMTLIVRHQPQRDEDNTWRTWLGALAGAPWSAPRWPAIAPGARWTPRAFASIADPSLNTPVRYELYRRR